VRGSPLLRALLAFLCILALGFPLWKLTSGASSQPAATPTAPVATEKAAIHLQLTFTATPASVKVLHLGAEIWSVEMPAQELEKDFKLEYPKEGVDLQFDIEWPGDTLSAMKVVLTKPDGTQIEKSVWGRGSTSEVLTFP
jgi:hypothetical protein